MWEKSIIKYEKIPLLTESDLGKSIRQFKIECFAKICTWIRLSSFTTCMGGEAETKHLLNNLYKAFICLINSIQQNQV